MGSGTSRTRLAARGIVDRRIEIANLARTVAAEFQAVRQYVNAHLARKEGTLLAARMSPRV